MRAQGWRGGRALDARPGGRTFPERPKDKHSHQNTRGKDCIEGRKRRPALELGPQDKPGLWMTSDKGCGSSEANHGRTTGLSDPR